MKKVILIFFIPVVALLSGCGKDSMCNCLKNTGDEITETRMVSSFTDIEMNNNVDIILTPDTFYSVRVTCGKNLIDGIITEVNNNTLYIRNINKCNWLRDFENKFVVEITLPTINQITNNGSGYLTCSDTIRGDYFKLENWSGNGVIDLILVYDDTKFKNHTGSADIIARGKSKDCYVYNAANGYFKGFQFKSEYCYVITKSTGDCEIYATKELGATIEYQGDIYYSGNPEDIVTNITGTGKLIPK